ncbi:TetR/AcrR family transcriptional regulator [Arthrobacter citreus]|uniref:TetR/AcrR family transcriptional regulator n=1 Tax=Arthrobacter TaxID=1663 RepID=UPI001479827B|nr:TetR family transcriptional regulator [Arthrobacter gandavensis]
MTNSASPEACGLRERKRIATKVAIITAARSLTAARGVNGFTVEELCEKVGISRRTFFNYFPAKEDAILGSPADEIPADLAAEFIAGGAVSAPGSLSPSLLADFVDFAVALMERMAMSRGEMTALKNALAAEPRLLHKVMHGSHEAEEALAALLSAREGLSAGDPRIQAALALFSCLTQRAGPAFFAPGNTRSYRSILTDSMTAMQQLFAAAEPVAGEPPSAVPSAQTPPTSSKDIP